MKTLFLNSENLLTLTGAKKIISCTPAQCVVETTTNKIVILGQNIEVKKLDLDNGEIVLQGDFTNIKLQTSTEKKSLLKRIFK